MGLVQSLVWWKAHAAIATVSSSCLIGISFPGGFLLWGWVHEVAFGGGSDYVFGLCGVTVSSACVLSPHAVQCQRFLQTAQHAAVMALGGFNWCVVGVVTGDNGG